MPNLQESEVQNIIKGTDIKTFVETGTRYGWTLSNIAHLFDSCHTIEISEHWHHYTTNGLHGDQFPNLTSRKNITFHLGDSTKVLPGLLAELDEPLLIFLDAHYMSAGRNAYMSRGEVDVPLYAEIDAIINHPYPDIVVVDDIDACGKAPDDKETNGADWTDISIRQMVEQLKPKKYWLGEHNHLVMET